MNMLDLLNTMRSDEARRRFKLLAAFLAGGLFLIAGAWIDGSINARAEANRPQYECWAEADPTRQAGVVVNAYRAGDEHKVSGVQVPCP